MVLTKRMKFILAIAGLTLYAGLACWQWTFDRTTRGSLVIRLYPPFVHLDGLAWRGGRTLPIDSEALRAVPADDPNIEGDRRTPVVVYEDGEPLGPSHNTYADIRDFGRGRFSYWSGPQYGLFFSTSDSSDPNQNGRHYLLVVP